MQDENKKLIIRQGSFASTNGLPIQVVLLSTVNSPCVCVSTILVVEVPIVIGDPRCLLKVFSTATSSVTQSTRVLRICATLSHSPASAGRQTRNSEPPTSHKVLNNSRWSAYPRWTAHTPRMREPTSDCFSWKVRNCVTRDILAG